MFYLAVFVVRLTDPVLGQTLSTQHTIRTTSVCLSFLFLVFVLFLDSFVGMKKREAGPKLRMWHKVETHPGLGQGGPDRQYVLVVPRIRQRKGLREGPQDGEYEAGDTLGEQAALPATLFFLRFQIKSD